MRVVTGLGKNKFHRMFFLFVFRVVSKITSSMRTFRYALKIRLENEQKNRVCAQFVLVEAPGL